MKPNINLQDVIEANQLLMSMGGSDQLPVIASAAIERSLELQHRIERAVRYAEETHTNSLHARQMLRILDGSITLDDENNEVIPEPILQHQPVTAGSYPRLVQQSLPKAAPAKGYTYPRDGSSGLAGRTTAERKAFREWLSAQGVELPLNQAVPQHYVDAFDKDPNAPTPRPRSHKRKPDKQPRGKLKPGHGLEGRSMDERQHIRDWLTEQGFSINPTGRIPQQYINHYDAAQAEIKRMQREARAQQQQQPQEQEQHAQGA